MDDAIIIYQNRSDNRFFDANTQRMQGGPDKVIVYLNGLLCTMDREARITIPVSRWKLAEIGFSCFVAALKKRGTVPRSVEVIPTPDEEFPEAIPESFSEALAEESPESRWEELMNEMRDLSR
jgi:hypothetical protein